MSQDSQAPIGTAYQRWYAKNKEKFNSARKKKYAEDVAMRDAVVDRQREYRKTHSVSGGMHHRKVGGVEVEVVRIARAAEMIGRSIQVIRIWERIGRIPLPSVTGNHRYYTMAQVKLMSELADLMNHIRYDHGTRLEAVAKKVAYIKTNWSI